MPQVSEEALSQTWCMGGYVHDSRHGHSISTQQVSRLRARPPYDIWFKPKLRFWIGHNGHLTRVGLAHVSLDSFLVLPLIHVFQFGIITFHLAHVGLTAVALDSFWID